MRTIKQLASTTILILCTAFCSTVPAQMPALDLAIDSDQVRFAATEQETRVEVFAPSGEMIFDSGAVTGQAIEWKMQNALGERVPDGTYLVTIQLKTATGQIRKRIEQVTVGIKQQEGASPNAAQAAITGAGTANKIAKFTGAATIGNSAITDNAGKIGIGTAAPASLLTVIGNVTVPVVAATNNSTTRTSIAVKAVSNGGYGVRGESKYIGVYGLNTVTTTAAAGVWGRSTVAGGTAVFGEATNGASFGVWGRTSSGYGVRGEHSSGTTGAAVYGVSTAADGNGILAEANTGTEAFAIWGKSTNGEAGHFTGKVVVNGDLDVLGTLSKDAGAFKIDHPLDPANKYLYHSFVESPDMMNIYNGNITLDANGEATITMPRWFSALNREFRYQLTAIGAPGPNLYIAEEMKGNRFRVAGGTPGMKVSWQVTGIRKDAYAEAHRIPVEEEKPEKERGSYLHPKLYGQSEEKGLEWAQHPEKMRK